MSHAVACSLAKPAAIQSLGIARCSLPPCSGLAWLGLAGRAAAVSPLASGLGLAITAGGLPGRRWPVGSWRAPEWATDPVSQLAADGIASAAPRRPRGGEQRRRPCAPVSDAAWLASRPPARASAMGSPAPSQRSAILHSLRRRRAYWIRQSDRRQGRRARCGGHTRPPRGTADRRVACKTGRLTAFPRAIPAGASGAWGSHVHAT